MGHVPHLFLPGPWTGSAIDLAEDQEHHLAKVLRRPSSSPISYTDGAGLMGEGVFVAGHVVRDSERSVAVRRSGLCMAVAPPRSKDRARMIVEKLAELGVDELRWISTRFGQSGAPEPSKARAWAIGALEQSRGAWLMEVSGPATIDGLPDKLLVADVNGSRFEPDGSADYTMVIGPEGGLSADEVPELASPVCLSDQILRVETAAVVGAAVILNQIR